MPGELALTPFVPGRRRWTPTAGTGLGLSIAKGIVDAHGGLIELEQTGDGTSFRIQLPVEAQDSQVDDTSDPVAYGDRLAAPISGGDARPASARRGGGG
jgi:hypothetical protein